MHIRCDVSSCCVQYGLGSYTCSWHSCTVEFFQARAWSYSLCYGISQLFIYIIYCLLQICVVVNVVFLLLLQGNCWTSFMLYEDVYNSWNPVRAGNLLEFLFSWNFSFLLEILDIVWNLIGPPENFLTDWTKTKASSDKNRSSPVVIMCISYDGYVYLV